MPVNSLSGSLSTAVYFASMFLLLFVLAAPVRTAYQEANLRAAQQVASGVATQIDDLSPGMESSVSLQSSPGVTVSLHLAGSNVTAFVDGESANAQVRWNMADVTLEAGHTYTVAIESVGGESVRADDAAASYDGVVEIEA
ncbi:MAG: hypothetical protein OK441_05560 [Thaumarchaeota archaeon]|nr:hypothetical protein [Nitrososphaerota archaeon]